MRRMFLGLSVLLLGISWAVAQDSAPTSGGQSSYPSSSQSQSGSAGQMTVEGCLSGSSGNFTLTDKNGMAYQLTGDTAKLGDHVGHEVKVTGMSASGSASGGESASGASSGAGASAGQTLHVSSVKHIAKTCKSGGGGMAH